MHFKKEFLKMFKDFYTIKIYTGSIYIDILLKIK